MATLESGSNRLAQIDRRRNLADQLSKMALEGPGVQNFRHPLQGWAMLAQALAANYNRSRADKMQKEHDRSRQQALLDALQPVQEPVVQQFEKIEGTMPDGSPIPAIPNQTFKQPGGGVASYPRDKTMEELITSLPPDLAEPAILAGIEARMKSQYGTQKDRYKKVGDYDVSGKGLESVPIHRDTQTGQLGLLEATGFRPVNSSELSEINRQSDVPVATREKQLQTYTQAAVAMDQIDRLRELVAMGGLTEDTFIGNARSFANNVVNAFRSAGLTVEAAFNGGTAADRGQLLNPDYYKSLDVTEQDKIKYDLDTIAANQEFLGEFNALDAKTQQLSIAIAYTLARIADPGGRLSEMDVMNQVRSLGLHSMSQARRLAALEEAEKTFAETVWQTYEMQQANGIAPNLPPGFEARIQSIRNQGSGSRMPQITLEEAIDQLNKAKDNPEQVQRLFNSYPPEIRRQIQGM